MVRDKESKYKNCRSFKHFDENLYLNDLQKIDFEKLATFENVNEAYDTFTNDITEVTDKHVPFKERKICGNQVPFFNSELRKAVYRKKCYIINTKSAEAHKTGNYIVHKET